LSISLFNFKLWITSSIDPIQPE